MASGFSFGSTGTSGAPSSFNPTSTSGQNSQGGLFGTSFTPSTSGSSTAATTVAPSGGLFSGGVTAGASPFGASNNGGGQAASIFGNTGSKPGSGSATPTFGGNSTAGGMAFGKPAVNTSSSGPTGGLFGTANTSSSPFGASGGFSFGQKKDEAGASTPVGNENKVTAATPTTSLFGNLNNTPGAGLFGASSTNNAATSTPSGVMTPATTKPSLSFTNSTTPAGPPPTDNTQASKPSTSNMFASTGQQPAGGLFAGPKPSDSGQTPATAGSLFAGTSNTTGPLFGPKPTSSGGLFGGVTTSTPASTGASTTPTTTTTSSTPAPKPAFSFPSSTPTSNLPANQTSSTPTTAAAGSSGLFFGNSKATPISSAPRQTSNQFSALSSGTATTSGPGTTQSLFSGLGKTSVTAATSTTTTTAPSNLFGSQSAANASTQPAAANTAATGPTSNVAPPGSTVLGASTAGPTPQLSRLKNKTMDEIITRWASDLSKYQKEFQDQAAKVAAWDRLLVENGEKIQKLYLSTFEAERASTEVERQLATVESQQDELAAWLDRYEADVDEMFARQVGQGETLQGPDQERERTYKLAEKLTDRLDEMGKDLTSMIEAVNEASATLSKSRKSDDPLSHIVRVLNSHLTQLQWIDQNAGILQAKVAAAQKLRQTVGSNGYGGQDNDTVEAFYRSYTGKR